MEKATFAAGCSGEWKPPSGSCPEFHPHKSAISAGTPATLPTKKFAPTARATRKLSKWSRSGEDPLCRSPEGLLGESRSHAGQPPGTGLGRAIPLGHLLSFPRAASRSSGLQRITGEGTPLLQADRNSNVPGGHLSIPPKIITSSIWRSAAWPPLPRQVLESIVVVAGWRGRKNNMRTNPPR